MSEYQYYEFRAIDRPLTDAEMGELRALSTRAEITPSSFINVYNYGDFRGDPRALMECYFDAFVYVSNWGTRQLMFRMPRGLVDEELAGLYALDGYLDVYPHGDDLIVAFQSEEEEPEWEEGEGWLDALLPLRAEIESGDLRPLYLSWLAMVYTGEVIDPDEEDEELEPPVPPGLNELSPAQRTLVDFLRVDRDLLAAAAARSPRLPPAAESMAGLERWIRALPEADRTDFLLRLAEGEGIRARADLLRRFRRETMPASREPSMAGRRAVAELVAAANELVAARERAEEERRRREGERKARQRAAYLDALALRTEETWRRVEALVEMRRAAEYDEAVADLVDLREAADRTGTSEAFKDRLGELRARHRAKSSFMARLDAQGLESPG